MKAKVTIEQLAEKMGQTVWQKESLKRIYLNNAGYNTKKMSTKAFIFQKDDEFCVSVRVECPSQPYSWIKSQEIEVRESVESEIEEALSGIEPSEPDTTEAPEPVFNEEVEKTKACKPVPIIRNKYFDISLANVRSIAELSESEMGDAGYSGCGKGIAYVRDKHVIAFQYGYEKASNAPDNCTPYNVDFSCRSICFKNSF
ncbi:MAG: hypothetical protein LBR26_09820 [Prevotella sp.]|jgi:hypothetical protein|nr:hypothetical protein [Prevotella sp.]